jgi:hypothetical protein
MSWSLSLSGRCDIAHEQLEDKVKQAKEGRNEREHEHIDVAADLFTKLVPKDHNYGCSFSVSGHASGGTSGDVSFNTTCSVYAQ